MELASGSSWRSDLAGRDRIFGLPALVPAILLQVLVWSIGPSLLFGNLHTDTLEAAYDGGYVAYLARRSERMSRALAAFRKVHELGEDELLVFLAVGGLNIQPHESGLPMFVSVTARRLAAATGLSSADVRISCEKLKKKGLMKRRARGLAIADLSAWRDLAETLL